MNKVPNSNIDGKLSNVLEQLYSLHRFGIKPGLDRTHYLLEQTGFPHKNFKSIHIAGTNGKGSVSSILASILTEEGYKTALYTSPHIARFNERIRINGEMISYDDLGRLAEKYLSIATGTDSTFFEITTAIAFDYFAENRVDIAIIETGMGGRFDSTNVITPLLSIITSISLDHQEYLGDTIEKIAEEKAGIIKRGVPIVIGSLSPSVKNIITCKIKGLDSRIISASEMYSVSINEVNGFERDITLTSPTETYSLKFSLPGEHQLENLKIAIASIEELKKDFDIHTASIVSGVENISSNTGLHGRIELLRKKPTLILDTSHNLDSTIALVSTLKETFPKIDYSIIFAVMKDKDYVSIIKILSEIASELIFVKLDNPRALSSDEFSKYANSNNLTFEIMQPSQAMRYAFNLKTPAVITGSFYLAEHAINYIENNNFQTYKR